jgi:hypothetical protein
VRKWGEGGRGGRRREKGEEGGERKGIGSILLGNFYFSFHVQVK